jgi:hypothetical protein
LSFQSVIAQSLSNKISISLKDKGDKFIKIRVLGGSAYAEGYDGDEIIIEPFTPLVSKNVSAAASGLANITALTHKLPPAPFKGNNPQIDEVTTALQVMFRQTNAETVLIKVPRNVHFSIFLSTTFPDAKLSVKDLNGEIEVGGNASHVDVSNISGPLVCNLQGITNGSAKLTISHINWQDINVIRTNRITSRLKEAVYITSGEHNIDISLPHDLKATVKAVANNGELYSDLNLVPIKPDLTIASKNSFSGELNGGGVPIYIRSVYGDIFLRKEK